MNKIVPVRVRFAPSPTGFMHIGNLRVALFNWLFARHNAGYFLLRIEDTDLERSCPEYTEAIFESLEWCKVNVDETPVIQSQQKYRHDEIAKKLLDEDKAYRCYCTPEELTARLGKGAAEGEYTKYDGHCRSLKEIIPNKPYAIRFKIPDGLNEVTFKDLVRGDITFKRDQLDDFIIFRSDGMPVYNFVVVVDDADMNITHVIRGEDHIPNTPKQILLYQAAGFNVPLFAHLPMILGAHGNRLSKRDAAVGVLDYKKQGFLSAALCNYLVRLGWAHGDQEIFSMEELVKNFTLEDVGKKSAIFDIKKLEWLNGVYIRNSSSEELINHIIKDCDIKDKNGLTITEKISSKEKLISFIKLYQDRSKTLIELVNQIYSLLDGPSVEELSLLKDQPENLKAIFNDFIKDFNGIQHHITSEIVKNLITKLCEKYNISFGDFAKPIRIALTGKTSSPSVGELIATLDKNEILLRLGAAINFLGEK